MLNSQRLCMTVLVVMVLATAMKLSVHINCDDIFAADNNSSYIVVNTINESQITNCVKQLNNKNLTKTDATYFWQSIVKLFNGVSNIPEETISVLHWIIPGINTADYANLTFTDIDMIQNFGLDYNLTTEQLSAIADRVRQDFSGKEPKDYTTYDLLALRNILCGFNGSEIENIHPSAYKEASEELGKLKCKSDVMEAFATLAVHEDAYGAPEKWDDEIIKTIGEVAKYLPKAIIDKFHIKKS